MTTKAPPPGFLEGSKFKGTFYHGTDRALGVGHSLRPEHGSEYGIYLTPRKRYASLYGENVLEARISTKRPLIVESKAEISPDDLRRSDIEKLRRKGYDSIVSKTGQNVDEIVLFEPTQVWVFSSPIRMRNRSTPKKRNPIKKMPGGSVTGCIKRERKQGRVRDPGAYCAAIADNIEPGWRKKTKKRNKQVARRRITRNASFNLKAFNKLTDAQKKKYRAARKAGKTATQAMRAATTSSAQKSARKAKRGSKSPMKKAQRERLSSASKAGRKKKATKKKATKKKATKKKTSKKKTSKKRASKKRASKKRASKKKTSTARKSCFTAAERKKIDKLLSQLRALMRPRAGEPKKARDHKRRAAALLRAQLKEIKAAAACRLGVQRAKKAGQNIRATCKAPPRSVPKSAQLLGYARARSEGQRAPTARQLTREFMKK